MLDKILLPGAGGPALAVVVPAPDEVDDGGQARTADADQAHGQVIVPTVISYHDSAGLCSVYHLLTMSPSRSPRPSRHQANRL